MPSGMHHTIVSRASVLPHTDSTCTRDKSLYHDAQVLIRWFFVLTQWSYVSGREVSQPLSSSALFCLDETFAYILYIRDIWRRDFIVIIHSFRQGGFEVFNFIFSQLFQPRSRLCSWETTIPRPYLYICDRWGVQDPSVIYHCANVTCCQCQINVRCLCSPLQSWDKSSVVPGSPFHEKIWQSPAVIFSRPHTLLCVKIADD